MSRQSRWIYRDMLDVYYDSESPLPLDMDVLCAEIGVESDDERKIVERLLRFKFIATAEGYRHGRCDIEIANYHAKADIAKANGKLGGRPRKANQNPEKPSGFPSGSDSVPIRNPIATGSQANQEPRTKNQEPINTEPTVLVVAAENPASNDLLGNVVSMPKRIPCPYERIVEVFHEACPSLPRIAMLSDKRKKHLAARWSGVDEKAKFTSVDDGLQIFRDVFGKAHTSNFLSGRSGAWKASFDWLIESETNFLKVVEGNYDNDQRAQK